MLETGIRIRKKRHQMREVKLGDIFDNQLDNVTSMNDTKRRNTTQEHVKTMARLQMRLRPHEV